HTEESIAEREAGFEGALGQHIITLVTENPSRVLRGFQGLYHRIVLPNHSERAIVSNQLAQIVHHQMRAVAPKLIGIPLARDTNNKPELAATPGLHSGYGIFDDNRSRRFNAESFRRYQKRIRSGLSR